MEAITATLVLLASVVASSIIRRAAGLRLPLALVQIAFGALVAALFDYLLAAGGIVVTLLAANAGLPVLLAGIELPRETLVRLQEQHARCTAAAAALGAVEAALDESRNRTADTHLVEPIAARLVAHYREQVDLHRASLGGSVDVSAAGEIERRLRLLALGAASFIEWRRRANCRTK